MRVKYFLYLVISTLKIFSIKTWNSEVKYLYRSSQCCNTIITILMPVRKVLRIASLAASDRITSIVVPVCLKVSMCTHLKHCFILHHTYTKRDVEHRRKHQYCCSYMVNSLSWPIYDLFYVKHSLVLLSTLILLMMVRWNSCALSSRREL